MNDTERRLRENGAAAFVYKKFGGAEKCRFHQMKNYGIISASAERFAMFCLVFKMELMYNCLKVETTVSREV